MASTLVIQKTSITQLSVDCIVNAANSRLLQGGGVCGAIFAAAGANELQAACDQYHGCPTGEAVITPGFRLKAKYIIHAVGPRWLDGEHGEPDKLYSCYRAAMLLAMGNDCHSIAFPLISSGIYGYPKKEAWGVAIKAIRDFQKEHADYLLDAVIAVLDEASLQLGQSILGNRDANGEEW